MTTEELKAKLADVKSIEEAYALAKECGYTGTMEEFKDHLANAKAEAMDLDAMDNVAGGVSLDESFDQCISDVNEGLDKFFEKCTDGAKWVWDGIKSLF